MNSSKASSPASGVFVFRCAAWQPAADRAGLLRQGEEGCDEEPMRNPLGILEQYLKRLDRPIRSIQFEVQTAEQETPLASLSRLFRLCLAEKTTGRSQFAPFHKKLCQT